MLTRLTSSSFSISIALSRGNLRSEYEATPSLSSPGAVRPAARRRTPEARVSAAVAPRNVRRLVAFLMGSLSLTGAARETLWGSIGIPVRIVIGVVIRVGVRVRRRITRRSARRAAFPGAEPCADSRGSGPDADRVADADLIAAASTPEINPGGLL